MADQVSKRLLRIRGQVDGIIKMYDECRECSDVVMQIAAVREALSGVGKEILTSEVVACDRDKDRDKLDKLLKKLFKFS
jgi:CsoR family transcriptional regulator, copper-sensing transcriptional repressor